MKVFGCCAYTKVLNKESKLDYNSRKCIFVGYSPGGYRVLNPETNKIELSRDIIFDENVFPAKNSNSKNVNVENIENVIVNLAVLDDLDTEDVPTTVSEAKKRPDWSEWKVAIEKELKAMKETGTWEIVKRPKEGEILTTKWVFKIKDGKTYKARLVARGCESKKELSWTQVYAPVAKMESVRSFLVMILEKGFVVRQTDFKNAFLNGELEEEIYIELPEGLELGEEESLVGDLSNFVCLLKKAIYGLAQAPKAWNDRLHEELKKLGFERCEFEPCIYINESLNIYLIVYVDDVLIAGKDRVEIDRLVINISAVFKLTDFGFVKSFKFLGIEIDIRDGRMELSQGDTILKIFKRFIGTDIRTIKTPIEKNLQIEIPTVETCNQTLMKNYKMMLGSLVYIMLGTRPDICFAVSFFAQF